MRRTSGRFALHTSLVCGVWFALSYGCDVDETGTGDALDGGSDDATSFDASRAEDGAIDVDGGTPDPDADAPAHDAGSANSSSDAGSDAASDAGSDAASDAGGDADAGPPRGPLSDRYVDRDINHVLNTGQSNATANSASPHLSTMQPFTNVMFNGGPMVGASPTSFVPLVEGDNGVETIASGMGNRISQFALDDYRFNVDPTYPTKHDTLFSNHGRSGWTYWCLRKNGCTYKAPPVPFADAMGQVTRGKSIADGLGKTYVVRAVTSIHGESDHTSYAIGTPEFPLDGTNGAFRSIRDYSDGMLEWQADYEASIKAITGQAEGVPLFISQISGWNNSRFGHVAQYQYLAHKRSAGKVVLIGAAYMMPFREDCLHYTAAGQRRLGEYFAKVYARVIFGGETWEPVRPASVARAANVITVQYFVPRPPLVLDTTLVTNPGQFGFEFVDDNGAIAITNVAVAGSTVTLALASAPTGANGRLRYGHNQIPSTCVGPGTTFAGGARGNLRDSDDAPSRHGYALHNWGVIFEEPVP